MIRAALLSLILPSPLLAEACPAWQDPSDERLSLMAELAGTPDAAAAAPLMDALWRIWTHAPDAEAQEMLDRGMERREAYDFDAATQAFDELVVHCPDYAEGYNQRAFVAFLRQDYGAALTDLERAVELNPDHIGAKAGLAVTLTYLGRIDAAQAVLREALAMNPWLPERGFLIEPMGDDI